MDIAVKFGSTPKRVWSLEINAWHSVYVETPRRVVHLHRTWGQLPWTPYVLTKGNDITVQAFGWELNTSCVSYSNPPQRGRKGVQDQR